MAILETLQATIATLYTNFFNIIPNVVLASIVLVIGYVVGKVVASVVEQILVKMRIDKIVNSHSILRIKMSHVFGTLTKWTLYVIFIQQATLVLGLSALIGIVDKVVALIPGLVGAAIVLLAAYAIAIYMQNRVIGAEQIYSDLLGKMLFFLIIYVGIATALPLVKIPTELINQILLVIIASIGAGVAIALGLGLKDTVAELAKMYVSKYKRGGRVGRRVGRRQRAR